MSSLRGACESSHSYSNCLRFSRQVNSCHHVPRFSQRLLHSRYQGRVSLIARSRIIPRSSHELSSPLRLCRHASTATSPSSSGNELPSSSDPAFTPNDTLESFDPYADYQIDEHIGYLKELGLDYGVGPTSIVQWAMEHVHIYSGLPWGFTIVLTAALFRLSYLKMAINANDMSTRMRVVGTHTKDIDDRIKEARANGDREQMLRASSEKKAAFDAAGIKISKIFVGPILIQMPLGFGLFRLLRGMGNLPVPGFDEAGMLWFTDLSMPDPFGILPIGGAAIFMWSFQAMAKSGEAGAGKSSATVFRYVIPTLMGFFGLFFPASLQLSIATTAVFTAIQGQMFISPSVRRALNMHPLPEPVKPQVLNVKGRVIDAGEHPPPGRVAKVRWHLQRAAKEYTQFAERMSKSVSGSKPASPQARRRSVASAVSKPRRKR